MKTTHFVSLIIIAALALTCMGKGGQTSRSCCGMMNDGMMSGMMNDGTVYPTNGETIFRTGKNKDGIIMQDLARSIMKMAHACVSCHGTTGEGGMMMMGRVIPSIKFKDLSDSSKHRVPYTEELIKRFLDEELKSDGTVAKTGVAWEMSEKDKNDLVMFLKTLE